MSSLRGSVHVGVSYQGYQAVKDSNRRWVENNKEAVAAIKRKSYEANILKKITQLGGKCACGSTDDLMLRAKGTMVSCRDCWKEERKQAPSNQPNWNSEKAKRRRSNFELTATPEQKLGAKKKQREATARYRKNHADRRAVLKAKRAAAKRKVPNSLTREQWAFIKELADNKCLCCHLPNKLSIDHVVALNNGGDNTAPNIQPLCVSCNSRKKDSNTDYRPEWWMKELHSFTSSCACQQSPASRSGVLPPVR